MTTDHATPRKSLSLLLGLALALTAVAFAPPADAFCTIRPGPIVAYRVCGDEDFLHVWVLGEDFGDPLP